jgi:hypothetical protein
MFRLFSVLMIAGLATACVDDATASDTQSTTSGSGAHRPPPQEALDACASLTAGAACAFDIDSHHVTGTCKQGPEGNGPLACAPDRPPLPPEALAACQSLSAGASCAFDIDSHHVTGTCKQGPDGNGPLACAPDQPPPR